MESVVLGIDGGGTKTLALLADSRGNEIARYIAGASNPNVVGIETAADRLIEATDACCASAGVPASRIGAVVLGLAGAGSDENKRGLRTRLVERYGEDFPVTIDTDARIALEGALGGRPGIVIIAGTGSVIVSKDTSGSVFVVGGWGRMLGDEGSGYFLGVEAAKAFARDYDHIEDASALRNAIRAKVGWETRDHLIGAIYREKFELSTLAPIVLELAGSGDAVCNSILRRAAAPLAAQVAVASPRVGTPQILVATCGGLIDHPTSYRTVLAETVERTVPSASVILPMRSAVDGAVLMALALAGGRPE
jgi:N-acetylglucosamine kinase